MLQNLAQHGDNGPPIDMPSMMEALAQNSARPRYAFMVLNLIASIAGPDGRAGPLVVTDGSAATIRDWLRSEEHTSELQSLMRISYDVVCLTKKRLTSDQHRHKRTDTEINLAVGG